MRIRRIFLPLLALLISLSPGLVVEAADESFLGVTRQGNGIPVTAPVDFFDVQNTSTRILVVGGVFGEE